MRLFIAKISIEVKIQPSAFHTSDIGNLQKKCYIEGANLFLIFQYPLRTFLIAENAKILLIPFRLYIVKFMSFMRMNRYTRIWLLLCCLLLSTASQGQFYIDHSRYIGGNLLEEVNDLQLVNGDAYLLGTTRSANFPVTNGTVYRGNLDMVLSKYDSRGNLVFASYIGGLGNDFPTAMQIVNNEVYVSLYTDSINFPVTNGSVFKGRRDIGLIKFNASGQVLFATYLGGSGADVPAFGGMRVANNRIYIGGTTGSADFPVTTGPAFGGGSQEGYVAVLQASDGNLIASRMIGGSGEDFFGSVEFDDQSVYLVGSSDSPDIPVTVGGAAAGGNQTGIIAKFSQSDLTLEYARYLGGEARDFITKAVASNGVLHVTGYTGSRSFPVTNGTQFSTQVNDTEDGFYTRLSPTGQILFSSYLSSNELDNPTQLIISNGDAYLCGVSVSIINGQLSALLHKVGAGGQLLYSRRYRIGMNRSTGIRPSYLLKNDEMIITGITQSALYPVTNGSQFFAGGTGFFSRVGSSGELRFSTYLGSMTNLLPSIDANNAIYVLGSSNQPGFTSGVDFNYNGGADNILLMLSYAGDRIFTGYVGGSGNEFPAQVKAGGGAVFIAGRTISNNYPVTLNQLYRGGGDQYLTIIRSCPGGYVTNTDSLSPAMQTVCLNGLGEIITGTDIRIPGDSLPAIYRNGVLTRQSTIPATYQWQLSFDEQTWSDIPGAIFRDYTPTQVSTSRYFRRAAFNLVYCGSSFIHYSDTAFVDINNLLAPEVDAGDGFISCPGFPVRLGGQPTASGGNPPYVTYQWDLGLSAEANPLAAAMANDLYTVIVTDSAGCRQLDQALLTVARADAGPDKGACAGNATVIGSPVLPGISGLQYSWSPVTGLNNTNSPQPLANPITETDYILSLSVPASSGLTCMSVDTVRVTPVAAPLQTNFAGPDKVACLGSTTTLGLSPEAGFNYVWSPGSYLTGNTSSTTQYFAGNIVMPEPNPARLNLTAQKSGCFFPDEVDIATIEARAGRDGCGPRLIGEPDRTPFINETYLWEKISGPGNFTGPTDQPQVPVSASPGAATTYRLTVTHNGFSCTDDITVVPVCSDCQTIISVEATYDCPSYSANGGNVTLIASSSIPNAVFSWSPTVGLTNYTGNLVQLTDNIPRVYTVTARDPLDSSISCSDNIFVNDPAFARPVFPALDTITCAGQPIQIGVAPVQGYSYEWIGSGLSGNLSSNPVATIFTSTAFPVTVTDSSGCVLRDTVLVVVQNAAVQAGPDQVLCSTGIVRLGSPAQPNTTYSWEPASAPWQNNSNSFSAQPEVLVATDISFIVTATTSAGCIIKDTVSITISNNPSLPDAPDTSTCAGNAVIIGTPAIPGVIYQWTPSTGLNNAGIAQPTSNPSSTTTYTVSAIFPGNCPAAVTDQVTVTVRSAAFDMPDINFCPSDGPVALGTNAPPGMLSYQWQPATQVSNASIPNPSTLNPAPKNNSTYTLLVNHPNGCSFRDTIRLFPLLTAPQAGPDRILCKGDSITIGTSANTQAPNVSYQWSPSTYLDNPLSPTPVFRAEQAGVFTYIITKTDQAANCSSKDTVVIQVQAITLSVPANLLVCQGSCINIGGPAQAGVQYQWFPVQGLSDPGSSNPIACVENTNQTYTVIGTNILGCSSSAIVQIAVAPIPAAQISIPNILGCVGDTNLRFNPVIQPAGPYMYAWSPDDGSLSDIRSLNPRIINQAAGTRTYQLQVTDTVSGCRNTASATLTLQNCPVQAIVGDYVWLDLNGNGLQDQNETGVGNITVELFNAAGSRLGITSTDPSGLYFFSNVPPGNGYYIQFAIPAGFIFTQQLVGGAQAINNSKANNNGTSITFPVPPGASVLNIDAGIRPCGPVPVTWLGFSGRKEGATVWLQWQTANEINHDYFIIERSADGFFFQPIGRVEGTGTTTSQQSYGYRDLNPWTGINYYRLKQVDLDGQFSYSTVVRVRFDKEPDATIWYDASGNQVKLSFSNMQPGGILAMYAANGQLIKQYNSKEQSQLYQFVLPDLAKGIYYAVWLSESIQLTRPILISR